MLSIVNYTNKVMGTPPVIPPIKLDAPMAPPITSEVRLSWRAPCWKFEKLQIMPLGFGYLESSEKSEKNTQILHI